MISILAHFVFATTLMNSPGLMLPSNLGDDHVPEVHFAVASKMTLADALDAYCKTTGMRVMANTQVQEALSQIDLNGFGDTRTMTGVELGMFVEGALVQNGYFLQKVAGQETYWVAQGDGHMQQLSWTHVDSQDLTFMRQHPAVLVVTILSVEHMDTRSLCSTLRPLLQQRWQGIYNVGGTSGIALKGAGTEVADMLEMLQRLDEQEAVQLAIGASLETADTEAQADQSSVAATAGISGANGIEEAPKTTSAAKPVVLEAFIFDINATNAHDILNTVERLSKDRSRGAVSSRNSGQARHTRFYRSDDSRRFLVRAVAAEHGLIREELKLAIQLHSKEG